MNAGTGTVLKIELMAGETPGFTRVAVGHQFNFQHRPRSAPQLQL